MIFFLLNLKNIKFIISNEYYSFLHRRDEAFSTEPMKNTSKTPLNFGHVQVKLLYYGIICQMYQKALKFIKCSRSLFKLKFLISVIIAEYPSGHVSNILTLCQSLSHHFRSLWSP